MLVTDFLSFNLKISPFDLYFWRIFSLDIKCLDDMCFSLSTLKMPFHFFFFFYGFCFWGDISPVGLISWVSLLSMINYILYCLFVSVWKQLAHIICPILKLLGRQGQYQLHCHGQRRNGSTVNPWTTWRLRAPITHVVENPHIT